MSDAPSKDFIDKYIDKYCNEHNLSSYMNTIVLNKSISIEYSRIFYMSDVIVCAEAKLVEGDGFYTTYRLSDMKIKPLELPTPEELESIVRQTHIKKVSKDKKNDLDVNFLYLELSKRYDGILKLYDKKNYNQKKEYKLNVIGKDTYIILGINYENKDYFEVKIFYKYNGKEQLTNLALMTLEHNTIFHFIDSFLTL